MITSSMKLKTLFSLIIHKLFSHLQNKQAGDSISDRSIDRNNHKSREMELQLGTIHILRNHFYGGVI